MAPKRKRDSPPVKLKSKKQRKRQQKSLENSIVPAENKYTSLHNESDGNDEPFEFSKTRGGDVILVESDDDDDVDNEGEDSGDDESDVVIVSEEEKDDDGDEDQDGNAEKFNELAKNKDFISFGFSSSEDEKEEGDYLDDGVISNDEGHMHKNASPKTLYPWIKDHDHSKQKEIADWLTKEMKDFVNYISPSKQEIETRNNVVIQLRRQITKFWPGTEVQVFGSYATDLYLPGSDIDMVIISQEGDLEQRSRLYQLSSFLRTKKLAKNIEVIAKAKVPIIKFVDPLSNIHIDVSFERTNGVIAAKRIRKWLTTTPGLRELVLIVKQFLRSRRLNNVHVGGLGGYLTIIMCYHFLKLHPRISTGSMLILDNLGSLLIEFFELYGRNFAYDNLILAIDDISDLPKYLLKRKHPLLNTARNSFAITIQDPSDPSNNITRSSYNLRDLKKAFGGAYQLLIDKCYELNSASYKGRIGQLILGDIIKYRGEERDFNDDRDKVTNHALISHDDDNNGDDDDELDGANGNDKYYFSDITVESEDDTTFIAETKEKKEVNKKRTEELMSVLGDDEEDDDTIEVNIGSNLEIEDISDDEAESKKPKSNLDKDIKRNYWRQKGLEL